MKENILPFSKSEGVESEDSHELASGDTMLVRPTLASKPKTHLEVMLQPQALRPSEEEHSSQEIEKGNQMATSANVSEGCALVNFDEGHQYV